MSQTTEKRTGRQPKIQGFFRLDQSDWEALERLAEKEERTLSDVVRRAVRAYLRKQVAA
jgi:predicted transcriptional regulator